MPSAFGKFLGAVAVALGFPPDKSRQQQQRTQPDPPRAAEPESPAETKQGDGPTVACLNGFPVAPDECRSCGFRKAKPEYYDQFCSAECERRFGDSMDAWHDQFEERFGDD